MSTCPLHEQCSFHSAVQSSVTKRVKYASAFPFCNTGGHKSCAIHTYLLDGRIAPADLLPTGGRDDYAGLAHGSKGMKVVVLDDSAVFAMFAANAVATVLPGASVVRCNTYDDAVRELADGQCGLVVCGYGVGQGLTAHDLRRESSAPMVLLTGRPDAETNKPSNSRVVLKEAGPEALRAAIGAAVGA